MPRYRIVVDDANKTNAFELLRYTEAFQQAGAPLVKAINMAKDRAPVRVTGFVHAEMNSECPDGGKNCRNCGDPEFAWICKGSGHCPNCGTKHGIAPDSVLAKNGFRLEEVV